MRERIRPCDRCDRTGVLVDTTAGEIIVEGRAWAIAAPGALQLMADPDGRARCQECVLSCNRCDSSIEQDRVREYEDGGPSQCSKCGLALPEPSREWLLMNGYEAA